MKSCIWLSIVVWLGLSFLGQARAATSAAVLGVRSLDGEDGLERRLSAALRKSALELGAYSLSEREVSLEQMSLAQGCEEPDTRCLTEIAKTLGVELLLYGTVVGTPHGYELTLYTFDVGPGRMTSVVEHQLEPQRLKASAAEATLAALLRRLSEVPAPRPPEPETGKLRLVGDVPGAQILVDGEARGALDDQGVLTLELSPGKHTVRAGGLGPLEDRLALVEESGTTELELKLKPAQAPDRVVAPEKPRASAPPPPVDRGSSRRSARRIAGWVTLGLGGAFAAATIYSWVRIRNINDSGDYVAYRHQFRPGGMVGGTSNACAAAAHGELAARDPSMAALERSAHSLCKEADTLETLQYVFLGGALLSAGVGTYLLVSARDRPQARVSVSPRFGTGVALLEANVRF